MKQRLVNLLIIIFGIYLIISLLRSIGDLWQKRNIVFEKEKKLAEVKKENEALKKEAGKVESPEYIEKIARDKLGMGKPGEFLIILPKKEKIFEEKKVNENLPNFKKWWNLFF